MSLELNAKIREDVGNNRLKTLRKKGFIPAIVYGPGHKPLPIQVDYQEFEKVFEIGGESTILKLKIHPVIRQGAPSDDGAKSKVEENKNVLIHDVDRDPVEDKFIHIDFYQIRMDKAISAEVPLVFEGEAPAVKNLEGVLVKNITEIEVEALPKDLPHEIKVDISCLETFDEHIRIKDLKLSEGVKILADPEEVIALVTPPRTKEELEELEEKVEEKIEEVEKVEEEEKIEEEKPEEEKPGEEKPAEEAEKPEKNNV